MPTRSRRAEIPLFPLGTVLFPGGPLPLRIFEARYIDLVRRCLREDSGFGVVLIRRARRPADAAETSDVGTYARIVDFSRAARRPARDRGARRAALPHPLAQPRPRRAQHRRRRMAAGRDPLPVPEEFAELGPALDYVLGQVGEPYASLERQLDDAGWVAGRLAEILPLPPVHKQHCLELDDPVERLRFLRPLFEITTEPPTDR